MHVLHPLAANTVDISWHILYNTEEVVPMSVTVSRPSRQRRSTLSCWIGGASLQEEGVAGVTDSHWFGRRWQRKLVVRAAVTENLPTVPTVVL